MHPSEVKLSAAASAHQRRQAGNRRLGLRLALVSVFFTGFGFAMVPLYDVICRMTGLNGRTSTVAIAFDQNTQVDTTRWVTVEFLSHSMPGVGLMLRPERFSVTVHPGAIVHTSYVARNETNRVLVGQAIPSVTPAIAAPHLQKIECFCFNQQTFQPGEERSMPVVFVVNPELSSKLGTITLSYTFFDAVKA